MEILHTILLEPIELLFEFIALRLYYLSYDVGVMLIGTSLAVSLMTAPIYRAAERRQREKQERDVRCLPGEERIRRAFRGDERVMVLACYRRQQHRQWDAIWSIFPLLIQIPFFLAAYRVLSDSPLFSGRSLGRIRDLAAADGLLSVRGMSIHVLPICMTGINLLCVFLYQSGKPRRELIQPILTALVFLLLLYHSPSGLVLYWICNNLYSLCRLLLRRTGRYEQLLRTGLYSIPALWYLIYVILGMGEGVFSNGGMFPLLLLLPIGYLIHQKRHRGAQELREVFTRADAELLLLLLVLLYGAVIPLSVITASPQDFIDTSQFYHPLRYVLYLLLLHGGGYLLYGNLFLAVLAPRERQAFCRGLLLYSTVSMVDALLFGHRYGKLSVDLVYEHLEISAGARICNTVVLLLVLSVLYRVLRRGPQQLRLVLRLASLTLFMAVCFGMVLIQRSVIGERRRAEEAAAMASSDGIVLSREGRNVMLIMLDRAIGGYFPYLLEEKPILREQFAGFTYYPQTLSFGKYTNFAVPALFGGYEYTPAEINARSEERLADKHNEAISVLPVLFGEAGYRVGVADIPYAGYQFHTDMSMYQQYPYVHINYWTGKIGAVDAMTAEEIHLRQKRFLYYGAFRALPLFLSGDFYEKQQLLLLDQTERGALDHTFLSAYRVLESLPELTRVEEGTADTFLMMDNDTTHQPCNLQLPDYLPQSEVDNSAYDLRRLPMRMEDAADIQHYQINMAALLRLGEYMDCLREWGVYDNTRIIIVADHGRELGQFADMIYMEGELDIEALNPLLLFKDFGAAELSTSEEFMTNADVPSLLLQGLLEEPINPFTGCRISTEAKAGALYVTYSEQAGLSEGSRFETGDAPWYRVRGGIFQEECWERLP